MQRSEYVRGSCSQLLSRGMYLHIITESQAPFLRHGLTYTAEHAIAPGTLVSVPLRSSTQTGIVLAASNNRPSADMDVKPITAVLSDGPVVAEYQLQALPWFCEYYCCTPRHALQVFLPEPPWTLIAAEKSRTYALLQEHEVPGKKQRAVVTLLKASGAMEEDDLRNATGASRETLASLVTQGILAETTCAKPLQRNPWKPLEEHFAHTTPSVPDSNEQPTLLVDSGTLEERVMHYAQLVQKMWNRRKSSLLLFPSIIQAEAVCSLLQEVCKGPTMYIVHSGVPASRRRMIMRSIAGEPAIVIGTRTALFLPLHDPGLFVLDSEHERTWKSEQTPRYHTRLVAEVFAKRARASLVLASATPSLDSLRHAIASGKSQPRYRLLCRPTEHPGRKVTCIDLTEAQFGSIYPFTTPLIEEMEQTLRRGETAVLLLNRRGTGSSLLCFGCRRPILSQHGPIPMSVITRDGAQWLLDRTSGEMHPAPAHCPHCGSVSLRTVGAGTERVEEIVRDRFQGARVIRVDGDTVEHPKRMKEIRTALDEGKIDIVLGTQRVMSSLTSHRVTLAAILVADIGLSVPDFRAGERIFQMITSVIRSTQRDGTVIVQTFRKDAPEIQCAIEGKPMEYLRQELALREASGFPPFVQLIDLIVRNDRLKAKQLMDRLQSLAGTHACVVTLREDRTHTSFLWIIRIRGKQARALLRQIPLGGVVVDIDPVE